STTSGERREKRSRIRPDEKLSLWLETKTGSTRRPRSCRAATRAATGPVWPLCTSAIECDGRQRCTFFAGISGKLRPSGFAGPAPARPPDAGSGECFCRFLPLATLNQRLAVTGKAAEIAAAALDQIG